MQKHLNICYLCAANDISQNYSDPARELVKMTSKAGNTYVWGGSDNGLMKLLADTAQSNGARIIGVSVEYLRYKARKNADEMIIAKDLNDRKASMLERSDVFVVLVGGIGTIDEVTAMIELKKHKLHDKPIIILNTEGFYDGFQMQLKRMEHDGFLKDAIEQYVTFVDTPGEVMALLKNVQQVKS